MPEDYDDDYTTAQKRMLDFASTMTTLTRNGLPACWVLSRAKSRSEGGSIPRRSVRSSRRRSGKWLLSTKGIIASRDVRRHVAWILDRLAGRDEILRSLQVEGVSNGHILLLAISRRARGSDLVTRDYAAAWGIGP